MSDGTWLALAGAGALALVGARRGSRAQQVDARTQTLRALHQRVRPQFQQWLAAQQWGDVQDQEDRLDALNDWLDETYSMEVRDDGLIHVGWDLWQMPRPLIQGLPLAMWHGTSTALLPAIRRQGLRAARFPQQRSDKTYSTMAGVYVSNWPDVDGYARMAARQHGGDPVVLTLRRQIDELWPDPDDADTGFRTGGVQHITPYVPPSDIVEWQ